jgi:hypothetical protein
MRPQSAKAKGRRLQQDVCKALIDRTGDVLKKDDVKSTSMGAPGEDVQFSPLARQLYPFSIECKNVEKINIWDAIKQAESQNRMYKPLVCFSKNGEEIYVTLKLKDFLDHYKLPRVSVVTVDLDAPED